MTAHTLLRSLGHHQLRKDCKYSLAASRTSWFLYSSRTELLGVGMLHNLPDILLSPPR